MPKAFQADAVEPRWTELWRSGGYFTADPDAPGEPYSIVIPPPNVTGALHMGHGLPQTIQDLLIRFNRMRGKNVCWVPGTDHAGIATQQVVTERLRQAGVDWRTLPREQFLAECWRWKEEYEARITGQIKRLGGSPDWSRYAFTMDAPRARSVLHAFKALYDRGLIYRGQYLVNWDPVGRTALSDDEVEHEEEQGFLYHLRYPGVGGGYEARVATTRPETLFGDVAVAVHPEDERYRHLIGRMVNLPLTGRQIPIVADPFVDREFGTGMVKITPAHDHNDFQCSKRLGLPMLNVFTDDAKLNEHGGEFAGLDRFEAREKVVARLKELGLLEKVEKYTTRIGRSYRSKGVVEPRLSEQWFVSMRPLAERAAAAVRDGLIEIHPKSYEGVFFHWMDTVRDWCISRQLVWGHRIPVWYRKDDPSQRICWIGEGAPPEAQAAPDQWIQDPDVLDTWFSSALWPFSVFGWPDTQHADLKKWFPTSVLVTGHDILFFWVARMIMMSQALTGQVPFRHVFLHGLIFGKVFYRREGQHLEMIKGEEAKALEAMPNLPKGYESRFEKMSKSKGNVLDPLEVIEKYGTDALRITLTAISTQGRTIEMERSKFETYRNFVNKFWNAARFTLGVAGDLGGDAFRTAQADGVRVEDRWILSRLSTCVAEATRAIERYEFEQYVDAMYRFFWRDYCDWYLELAKVRVYHAAEDPASARAAKAVLLRVLETSCRLLAPMAPFATEEVWQTLRTRLFAAEPGVPMPAAPACPFADGFAAPSLCVARWPVPEPSVENAAAEAQCALLQEVVTAIRTIRGEMAMPLDARVDVIVEHRDAPARAMLETARAQVVALVNGASLRVAEEAAPPAFAGTHVSGPMRVHVLLPESLRKAERDRLSKELARLENGIRGARAKLANPEFAEKAPAPVVAKERERLAKMEADAAALQEKLGALGC
jgi:valyl-tRNA synthetase